jgi:hypothetical protein
VFSLNLRNEQTRAGGKEKEKERIELEEKN